MLGRKSIRTEVRFEINDRKGNYRGNCSYNVCDSDDGSRWIGGLEMVNFSNISDLCVPVSTIEMIYDALNEHEDVVGVYWEAMSTSPVAKNYISMVTECNGTVDRRADGDIEVITFEVPRENFISFFEDKIKGYVDRF